MVCIAMSPAGRFATQGLPRRHPFETDEAPQVVDEILHPDFRPRADNADRANKLTALGHCLMTEHMLDTRAHR